MKALKSYLLILTFLFGSGQLFAQLPIDLVDDFATVTGNASADFEFIYDNDIVLDSSYLITASFGASQAFHGSFTFCPPGVTCIIGTTYTPDVNYVGPDSVYYYIEVYDNGAFWYSDSALVRINVTSNSSGNCTASFSYDTTNLNVDFTDLSFDPTGAPLSAVSWVWDLGDGAVSTLQNPSHTYSSYDSYQVCLSTTFQSGCVDTYCETIQIDSLPNTPSCTADFSFTSNGLLVGFVGSTTWIGTTPINYVWDFGNGNSANGDSVIFSFPSSGTYNVCLTTGIDCPNTICKLVSVSDTVCIDSSLINPNAVNCATVINPICGCDGLTYNNECEAVNFYGVVSWSPGDCNSSVWPGDTDLDGVVNNYDVLPIGLSFSNSGPQRANASSNWMAQSATNWTSGVNYINDKNVDTDGNGVIDTTDIDAIYLNYGLIHSKDEGKSGTGPVLIPNFMGQTSLTAGSSVIASIDYGTIDTPLVNVYGLAYTIEFDTSIIDASSINFDFASSWFNSNNSNVNFHKVFTAVPGRIEIAQTGTNQMSKSGFGSINQLTFVIQEDLAGKVNGNIDLVLTITNIKAIDKFGNEIDTKSGEASIEVEVATSIQDALAAKIAVYPNPTSSFINIKANSLTINQVELYTILGEKMPITNSDKIDVSALTSGIYFLKIQTNEGLVQKRIIVK